MFYMSFKINYKVKKQSIKYLFLGFQIILFNWTIKSQENKQLFWPEPPQKARIQHLQTISSPKDFGSEIGLFTKIINFIFGTKSDENWLVQPVGIATQDDIIYITDPGAKGLHIINLKKNDYEFVTRTKSAHLISPVGIVLSESGKVYVCDSQLKLIIIYNNKLNPENEFRYSEFVRPTNITIKNNNLYVVDTGAHKVFVFDLYGNFKFAFGNRGASKGEFNFPVSICISNQIFIVDAMNHRIQTFDLNGNYQYSFGQIGNKPGSFSNPKSIAVDSDNNVYVTDALMDNFQIFNNRGDLLLVVGSRGNNDGEFLTPNGITIDKNDNIYVVDMLNRRLQIFKYLK